MDGGVNAFQIMSTTHAGISAAETTRQIFQSSPARIPQTLLVALSTRTPTSSQLQMGIFDSFFQSRSNDFIKLDSSSQDTIGPGPMILLYNIPHGIDDEEISGMIKDGAPLACASKKGVAFMRIYPEDVKEGDYKDKSVIQVLKKALPLATTTNTATAPTEMKLKTVDPSSSPILYFSGMSNSEMMQTYKIIARELYHETEGRANAACAKVVEPAFEKSFGQLVEEISGDHDDAMSGATGDSDGDGDDE
jgi:hypothetical protein